MLAALGAALLALSLVGLVPMIREELAVRAARSRFSVERLTAVEEEGDTVAFRCGSSTITLSDVPSAPDTGAAPGPRIATVRIDGTPVSTTEPVPVAAGAEGADRYWSRVVPVRWRDRRAGESRCGVLYGLPPDTAAIRRARADRSRTVIGFYLESVRGVPGAWVHGLRFGLLHWSEPENLQHDTYEYADWRSDALGTLLVNLLRGPVGIRNQTLSYWPSLYFPFLYPFGFALVGIAAVGAGFAGWRRSRGRGSTP